MNNAIKAVRATILLGDIELDVFQLPDGEYRWSAKHIAKAINIRHSRVAQISATKQAQSLIGSKFEVADFSPNKLISDVGNISGYSTEVAFFVWQYEAVKGNELAQALVFASGVETLERRADSAFGVIKTENERNNWFTMRMQQSKIFRRSLTDAMKDREDATGEKAPFGYATLRIYRRVGLFDKYQKYKKAKFEDFKSSLTLGELEDLRACEEMVAQFMRKKNMDVMSAIDLYKELFDN